MSQAVSKNYEIFNSSNAKDLIYVLEIEGVPYVFGTNLINQTLKFGDAGAFYGTPGLVYGGSVPYGGIVAGSFDPNIQRPYLTVDKAGLSISQKAEPWEGKSSIQTLSFVLTDVNEEVLKLISPGVEIDEILLKKIRFYVGFPSLDFPAEYIRLYRGIISGVSHEPGMITLITSDPNLIRREKLFEKSTAALNGGIGSGDTTITVDTTDGFFLKVNAPGTLAPESGHEIGIKIGDEIIFYTGKTDTTFTGCTRGALGTVAASHGDGSEAAPIFQFEGNPLLLACKIMLSGGDLATASVTSIFYSGDPDLGTVPGAIAFGIDLKDRLGLIEGDFVTLTGTVGPGNDIVEKQIVSFFESGGVANAGIITEEDLSLELISTATATFRSQFDVYPAECALGMDMIDVDSTRHIEIATQFLTTDVADFSFTQTEEVDSGKDFIEKELYLPCGAYSLVRGGSCSVVVTAQPLPGISLISLNADNVIDPDKVRLTRDVTSRKFYNRVDFSLEFDQADGSFLKFQKFIDSNSLEQIPYREYLQIESKGMRLDRNAQVLIDRTVRKLFDRYSLAAQTIDVKVTWQIGAILEAGDIILIEDNGTLKFPNLATGTRDLGNQLWEVLEKQTDLKTGISTLKIISAAGNIADRVAIISPASLIDSAISNQKFRLKNESFGSLFPNEEWKKWTTYVGLRVTIHDEDFAFEEERILVSLDPQDPFLVTLDSPLSFTPGVDYVMELAPYSTGDASDQALAKLMHAYLSPGVAVVSGASDTEFDVGGGDIAKFFVGCKIFVHSDDYSDFIEVAVTAIVGTTITCEALGFTPDNTYNVTGIGFAADQSDFYRWYS